MSSAPTLPTAMAAVTLTLGEQRARMSQIDNSVWENNRSEMDEAALTDLFKSIKANGMLHNLVTSWKGDGTDRMGLIAGFRRYEANLWWALEKLFRDANGEKGANLTKPTMIDKSTNVEAPCGFDFAIVAHRKLLQQQWPVEYQAALDAHTVAVKVVDCKDSTQASLLNLGENFTRQDISVMDLCARVAKLLNDGIKGTVIAQGLACDKSKITHIKNIADAPLVLKTFLLTAVSGMTETEATNYTAVVNAMIAELLRRMALSKDEKDTIKFSHARQLAEKLTKKIEEFKTGPVLDVLSFLVKVDKNGKQLLKDGKPQATPDYDVFMGQLADAANESKKLAEAAAKAAEAAANPVAAAAGAAAGAGTVALPQATAEQLAQVNSAVAPTPAVPTVAAGAAAAAIANQDEAEGDDDGDEAGPDMASLVAGAGIDASAVPTVATPTNAADAGATNTKRETAPTVKYNTVDPVSLASWAADALTTASNAENSLMERYAQLWVAANCYQALQMTSEYEFVAGKAAEFYVAIQKYESERDAWIAETIAAYAAQGLKPLSAEMPTLVLE